MIRILLAASSALALVAGPAAAQIMPGLRAPESAADAIDEAQALLCTLAAAGRPMPGLNMDLIGGEGLTLLDKLPDALAPFVQSAPGHRIVRLKAPGEPVWVVHDPDSGRCSIYSFAEAAPVEAKLLAGLAMGGGWKRRKDAGEGVDHAFEWKMTGSVRLRTEISLPDGAGEPVAVVVRPAR